MAGLSNRGCATGQLVPDGFVANLPRRMADLRREIGLVDKSVRQLEIDLQAARTCSEPESFPEASLDTCADIEVALTQNTQHLTTLREELRLCDAQNKFYTSGAMGSGFFPPLAVPGRQQQEKLIFLRDLGYAEDDCRLALQTTNGEKEIAWIWLIENAPRNATRHSTRGRVPAAQKSLGFADRLEGPPPGAGLTKLPVDFADNDTVPALAEGEGEGADPKNTVPEQNGPTEGVRARHVLLEAGRFGKGFADLQEDSSTSVRGSRVGPRGRAGVVDSMSASLLSGGVCLCIIDDCEGRDLPLVEIKVSNLDFSYRHGDGPSPQAARLQGQLSCDYYNAALTCWEPFFEPWRVQVALTTQIISSVPPRNAAVRQLWTVTAPARLEMNITPALVSSLSTTYVSWQADFSLHQPLVERDRFVPYRLLNATGCPLVFWTLVRASKSGPEFRSEGIDLDPDQARAFDFGAGLDDRTRHSDTHQHIVHKVALKVAGWEELQPAITVDRVGIYSFLMQPDPGASYQRVAARLVVEIKVKDGRKIIQVHSALVVHNTLSVPIDIRLEFTNGVTKMLMLPLLLPNKITSIPVHLAAGIVKIRPHGWGYKWSTTGVLWEAVAEVEPGRRVGLGVQCCSIGDAPATPSRPGGGFPTPPAASFRCCISVIKEQYPGLGVATACPGHTITLLPPLVIENLLPFPAQYGVFSSVEGADGGGGLQNRRVSRVLEAGQSEDMYDINLYDELRLEVYLPGFTCTVPVLINIRVAGMCSEKSVRLNDRQGRLLLLGVRNRTYPGSGGARVVSVYSYYWMVNRSGLPLTYRQMNRTSFAAGQTADRRELCSATPVLFFCDLESLTTGNRCQIRVDKASWSPELAIDAVGRAGTLSVPNDALDPRGCNVYDLGVEISRGEGRFNLTKIITFSPRYVLANATNHALRFMQENTADEITTDPEHVSPQSSIPFHWPSNKEPHVLRVCVLDEEHKWRWSSGFAIDKIGTCHVKLLPEAGGDAQFLLRVEIKLVSSSFHVIFSDSGITPPFRIDNQSSVDVIFHQEGVDTVTLLSAGSVASYAWDDLSKPLELRLRTKESNPARSTAYDLQRIKICPPLKYTRYFYIAFEGKLVLGAKEVGSAKRSASPSLVPCLGPISWADEATQLWQMNAVGKLKSKGGYILEIETNSLFPKPSLDCSPRVTMRKALPGEKTRLEQQWKFEQGRLVSQYDTVSEAQGSCKDTWSKDTWVVVPEHAESSTARTSSSGGCLWILEPPRAELVAGGR